MENTACLNPKWNKNNSGKRLVYKGFSQTQYLVLSQENQPTFHWRSDFSVKMLVLRFKINLNVNQLRIKMNEYGNQ